MPKNVSSTVQLCSFWMLARLCSKSLLVFTSRWMEHFQLYKLDFKEAKEPQIKLPTFVKAWRKQGNSRKTSTSASLTMLKPLTMWITTYCGKFLKSGNTRPPYLFPEKPVWRSKSNSYNWTWKNRLVQNWERSMSRLYIVTLLFLTYIQSKESQKEKHQYCILMQIYGI